MNKDRRKALAEIAEILSGFQSELETQEAEIENIKDLEQESFDNLSEGLQQSENGQRSEAAWQALEEALNALQEATASIQEAMNAIDQASE